MTADEAKKKNQKGKAHQGQTGPKNILLQMTP